MFNQTLENVKNWWRGLPDKKRHIEFVTAILTVPVLLTVLITNLGNINQNKKDQTTPTPRIEPTERIIVIAPSTAPEASTSPTLNPECKKEVGPVRIASPNEGQLMSANPVCINIAYQTGEFCSVAWSYRTNEGDWSDFTDKEICLYNLDPGPTSLELRVKSSQSDDEVTLIRNFFYKAKEVPTSTPTPTTPAP